MASGPNQVEKKSRRRRVILPIIGVLIAIAVVALVNIRDSGDNVPEGLLFVIPAGASETVEVPTIDSAIEIPTEIVFAPGEVSRITIRNDDSTAHRAGPWVVGAGQSYTMRFDKPGEFQFDCTVDITESVTVTVEEP